LIQLYLDNFYIPANLITVTKVLHGRYFTDSQTVSLIEGLKFEGSIGESRLGDDTVLEVYASELLIRILWHPVSMLTELVATLAQTLSRLPGDAGTRYHQELAHDSKLANFVEARVGQYYGASLFGRAGMKSDIAKVSSSPRRKFFHTGEVPGHSDLTSIATAMLMLERPSPEFFNPDDNA
jgi:hypothetical protein